MMRRRKKTSNLWLLLGLPIIGTVGWLISRLIGSRNASPSDKLRISGHKPAASMAPGQMLKPGESGKTAEAMGEIQLRETGQKAHQEETKFTPTATQRAEATTTTVVDGVRELPSGHALRNQPERLSTFFVLLVPFLILPVAVILLAFRHIPVQSQAVVPGGDPTRGQAALQAWGCGSCHTIKGVTGADGKVGPALNEESNRSFIGGHLRNTPDNMVQWIAHPQQVSPGVDMPDSGVPDGVARDMAAYLYSIR